MRIGDFLQRFVHNSQGPNVTASAWSHDDENLFMAVVGVCGCGGRNGPNSHTVVTIHDCDLEPDRMRRVARIIPWPMWDPKPGLLIVGH